MSFINIAGKKVRAKAGKAKLIWDISKLDDKFDQGCALIAECIVTKDGKQAFTAEEAAELDYPDFVRAQNAAQMANSPEEDAEKK